MDRKEMRKKHIAYTVVFRQAISHNRYKNGNRSMRLQPQMITWMLPQIENGYYMSLSDASETEQGRERANERKSEENIEGKWSNIKEMDKSQWCGGRAEVKSKLHCTSNRIERWMEILVKKKKTRNNLYGAMVKCDIGLVWLWKYIKSLQLLLWTDLIFSSLV